MLAFMAYPVPHNREKAATHTTENNQLGSSCDDSVSTATMNERPPQSFLSLSTEASSAIWENRNDHLEGKRCPQGDASSGKDSAPDQDNQQGENKKNTTAAYIERIYENTVHGPCQTVTMCEVEHLDLFMNCQQPLSFLGFGHHPGSMDRSLHGNHNNTNLQQEGMPLPGAYDVPRGCEYCGAAHTRDCEPGKCRRPRLFFQKKRPPFAHPDDMKRDCDTDLIIRTGTKLRKQPNPCTQHR